jgi:hypothetical protein
MACSSPTPPLTERSSFEKWLDLEESIWECTMAKPDLRHIDPATWRYFVITNENVSEIDVMPEGAWGTRVTKAE